MPAEIIAFFDEPTFTCTYLLIDPATRDAAIIDPVLDFEQRSGTISAHSADAILARAAAEGARIRVVLETHVHADHLTAAAYIKARTGAQTGIGEQVCAVQRIFAPIFNDKTLPLDGREFDRLFSDGDHIALGGTSIAVMHTPGHTPACVTYVMDDAAFAGDTLFMPDYGTARTDFPGGDAATLYRSIRRILALPPQTRLFMCHDYKEPGRDVYAWQTSVSEQRARNIHIHDGIDEAGFTAMRTARDAHLPAPVLLLPSLQVNMRAGRLPAPEDNGTRYLKTPLKIGALIEEQIG